MKKARKGKGKGKSKHGVPIASQRPDLPQGITPSVAEPTQRDDPSTISPLPGHGSSPRGGDQDPTRPLYADIVKGRQQPRQHALQLQQQAVQPPVQSPEMLGNSSEDHDDYSPDNSTEDNDDSTLDCYSEDHDDLSAPDPSSPAAPGDLSSSSTTGARPTPAAACDPVTTSGGSADPEDSSLRHDTTPPPVEQGTAFPSPPSPIPAAAVQSPSAPLPAAAVPPPPSPSQRLAGQFNYATSHTSWANRFYDFLTSSRVYEALLHATTHVNKKHGTSDPYTVQVSYEQMWKLGAPVDLIRATCNGINNRHVWLLPAAKQFLRDNGCVNESNETCLTFSGFPESMQTLEDFKRGCSLVKPVFEDKIAPTVHGRLLIEMSMVAISENHSQDISWGGKFSEDDILIIKWSSKRRRVNHETYEMKILQDPVKDKKWKLRTAMVRDMRRAADIFIPLYKIDDNLPVYFVELKEDLEGAKEAFVANEWFREYLCYHVAIMPSIGRRDFEVLMHTMYTSCDMGYMPIMTAKPTVYPNDWRERMNSVENVALPLSSDSWNRPHSSRRTRKTSAEKHIDVLHDVYSHNNNPTVEMTDKYENSVRGLLRLKRNILEHGGQGRSMNIADLELCAAERFSEFLPWLVRTLLENEQMGKSFGVAWNAFMVSQADKSDPWSN